MNKQIEEKIRMLSKSSVCQIITDILLAAESQITGEPVQITEEKAIQVQQLIQKQRGIYKKMLKTADVVVKIRDIEDLIDDLRTGKEPMWTNKIIENERHGE